MKTILDLAKQAGLKFDSELSVSPQEQKFAELIIQECAKTIRKNTGKATTLGYEYYRPSEIADMIEYHFGLKNEY